MQHNSEKKGRCGVVQARTGARGKYLNGGHDTDIRRANERINCEIAELWWRHSGITLFSGGRK